MRKRVSIWDDWPVVDESWDHFEAVRSTITQAGEASRRSLVNGLAFTDPALVGMGVDELREYFESLLQEADKQASLFLLASAEAELRVDFHRRVDERQRDPVSRLFRETFKSRRQSDPRKVRLETDILDTWASEMPGAKMPVGQFKGALQSRHWLAHGRWWPPKFGQQYDPAGVFRIISKLFEALDIGEEGPGA